MKKRDFNTDKHFEILAIKYTPDYAIKVFVDPKFVQCE